jgi:hypothetical protein
VRSESNNSSNRRALSSSHLREERGSSQGPLPQFPNARGSARITHNMHRTNSGTNTPGGDRSFDLSIKNMPHSGSGSLNPDLGGFYSSDENNHEGSQVSEGKSNYNNSHLNNEIGSK